jgi:hypothetical protein
MLMEPTPVTSIVVVDRTFIALWVLRRLRLFVGSWYPQSPGRSLYPQRYRSIRQKSLIVLYKCTSPHFSPGIPIVQVATRDPE